MGATTLHSPSSAKPLLRASNHTETHTYKHTYTRKNKEFFVLCLNLWNQVTLVFVTLWPRKEKRGRLEKLFQATPSNHVGGWLSVSLSVCVCAVRICWSYNFWHLALFALHNIYEGKFGLPAEHPPLPFRGGEFAHVIFRSLLTFISIYYFMMMYAFLRPQLPISVFFQKVSQVTKLEWQKRFLRNIRAGPSRKSKEKLRRRPSWRSCTSGPYQPLHRCINIFTLEPLL